MAEKQQVKPTVDEILNGPIIERLAAIKAAGKFAPVDRSDEELGPEWEYAGSMSTDAKALWTMLTQIGDAGKGIIGMLEAEGVDKKKLLLQKNLLASRFEHISALMYNCIRAQVIKDYHSTGVDLNRVGIAIADDFKIYIRVEEEDCNCPLFQMGGADIPEVTLSILSPVALPTDLLEALALSAFSGKFGKMKRPEGEPGENDRGSEEGASE